MVSPVPMVPLAFDPPEHTRFRRILQPFFSPQTLGAMLPSLQSQVIEIIEPIADRRQCELMADLATPYPSQVFLTLFGLPLEDRDRLVGWKDAIIGLALERDPEAVDLTPAAELYAYLSEAVETQRQHPREGVLSEVLHGDDPLTDAEAIGRRWCSSWPAWTPSRRPLVRRCWSWRGAPACAASSAESRTK